MPEVKKFSLKRKEIPLEIEDEKGMTQSYVMREMNGSQRDIFLTTMNKKIQVDDSGRPKSGSDFTGSCSDLLALCIYDAKGILVPARAIQDWPTTLQEELVVMAAELSALGNKAKEEAKNA